LKNCIRNIEGIPEDQQLITFCGKQYANDNIILSRINVRQGSVMHLVLRLRRGGGGIIPPSKPIEFVDVNNPLGLKQRCWSDSAPEWRCASPGLSIEGICKNLLCEAYNNRIISNHKMGCFDLFLDIDDIKCPICDKNVVPITCAFNNCLWKTIGMKENKKGVVESNWNLAGDEYNVFNEIISGKSNWVKLWIKTIPPNTKNPDQEICLICNNEITYSGKILDCKHIYHKCCIEHWETHRKEPCPRCILVSFKEN
jgi:hypothetical protein